MSEQPTEFNQLPEEFEGEQLRRTDFESQDEKLGYDAVNLIKLARDKYGKEQVTVRDVLDLATRHDDDLEGLRRAIAIQIKDGVSVDENAVSSGLDQQSERTLTPEQTEQLLSKLEKRFNANEKRHKGVEWSKVEARLNEVAPEKLWSLNEMERTGGEPDVVDYVEGTGEYEFWDFSKESPEGRRNVCYDRKGQEEAESRGDSPAGNAADMKAAMGLGGILNREQINKLGNFVKGKGLFRESYSWVDTPEETRKRGIALNVHRYYVGVFVNEAYPDHHNDYVGFHGWLRV